MKKSLALAAALFASTTASAQLAIPVIGQLEIPVIGQLELPALGGGMGGLDILAIGSLGGDADLSSLLDVGNITDMIESDPLGVVGIGKELQGMGAPALTPLLLTVSPFVDAGPALPLLAPLLNGASLLPGLPNLDGFM
ncbi:hypothetical protein NCG89_09930 [Spongiibacter taiwanensis]|uniref:hypothetical protein n=1 Tax=Spongiibacter taiwanensis TaxID=1748242 RepID=UPI002034EA5E|nr:hypothetical protein [Spongiibacter taiwanensis]USA41836.1 hypothetical protein NCG89_09930 [Spongiibacter taiwanensis]